MELKYFREGVVFILGAIAALEVGSFVVSASAANLIFIALAIFAFAWILWAGNYWWTPILAGATMGGKLYFGFKIYPLDIAVLLTAISLIPMLLMSHGTIYKAFRKPLVIPFYGLALFIAIRLMLDMHASHSGLGNMARILFEMEWPCFFGWLFYHYGKTSVIPSAVIAVTVVTALRVSLMAATIFGSAFIYIPGINYIINGNGQEVEDMRVCAYFLMLTLLLLSESVNSFGLRLLLLLLSFGSIYPILMGGSRLATVTLAFLPVAFFAATRRWLLLFLSVTAALAVFATVNYSPALLDRMPEYVARALSGLLIKQEAFEVSAKNLGSNKWHSDLRQEGYHRWTSSFGAFAFGDDVRPYREDSYYSLGQNNEDEMAVSASADVGAYESGLWSVLGTLGATGCLLYLLIFMSLWRHTIPYLWNNRVRTIKDGVIFWGTYSSLLWFLFCYAAGSFPSFELVLMIIASAAVQDIKAKREPSLESIPVVRREIAYA